MARIIVTPDEQSDVVLLDERLRIPCTCRANSRRCR